MSSLITTLHLHVGLRQRLQFLDSYQQDNVSDEEIDFNLNQQQERFIDHLFSNEFQDEQRKLDYLQNIIVKNKTLPALEFGINDADFEDNALYAILPPDYMHLVNYRFNIWNDKTKCDLIVKDEWKQDIDEWVGVIPFVEDTSDVPVYQDVRINYISTINSKDETSTLYFRSFSLSAKEEVSPVAQDILRFFATPGAVVDKNGVAYSSALLPGSPKPLVYWENYRGIYYANSFIIVIPTTSIATNRTNHRIQMIIRDQGNNVVIENTVGMLMSSYSGWDETALDVDLTKSMQSGVAAPQDMMYDWQTQNAFFKPDEIEPHINLTKEKMYIYVGVKSIISTVRMDYIRRPRQISLSLNQTSELADNAPQRIVDWTIERMKLVLENPNVASLTQHNELKTK